jgi:hypothetical protein
VEHLATDADGLLTSPHIVEEAKRVFDLVPDSAVTHRTIASGDWSDPRIWSEGQAPGPEANVLITKGTTVRFDETWNQGIKTLRIDGVLEFATDRDTQMMVDTIVVHTNGKLHIGTAANPIANNVTARIVIPDATPIDAAWDPYLQSRGLISRGEVRMVGQTVTPFVSLAVAPAAGATQLVLSQVPVNWRVGDQIVLTGTNQYVEDFQEEKLVIRAIAGSTVTVDALRYNHLPPEGRGLSAYVANLSRNIQFLAEDPSAPPSQRPHIQLMHNPNIDIQYIGVYGFGRTDKSTPVNDAVVQGGVLQPGTGLNQRARYAIHFHHTGVSRKYDPAVVRGSVVVGSPGWGYVNHSSYVVMENNVAYDVLGAGFVTEDGNEIGVMRGNLSINNSGSGDGLIQRQKIHDFGHGGHGYWFQGPGVEVVDNIAAGSRDGGFVYFTASSKNLFDAVNLADPALAGGRAAVPVGAVPLARFDGNVAAATKTGLEIWHHLTLMPDVPTPAGRTEINNFTSWNSRFHGIDLEYAGQTTVNDAVLIGDLNEFNFAGVQTHRLTSDIVINNARVEGFEIGVDVPVRRNTVINGGYIAAVQGLFIEKGYETIRSVRVTGPVSIVPLTAAQLRGRQPFDVYASGVFSFSNFLDRKVASLFSADEIRINLSGAAALDLYFVEQAASYVPFPTGTPSGYVPAGYIGKTNLQLSQTYGAAFNGGLAPAEATTPPRFYGLAVGAAAVSADFDGDGDADGGDFLAWQRSVGSQFVPPGGGADGDGNGVVDPADLRLWKDYFGASPVAAAAAFPELADADRSFSAALNAALAGEGVPTPWTDARMHRPPRRTRTIAPGG